VVTALHQALGGLFKSRDAGGAQLRTDEDLSYPVMLGLGALAIVAMAVFFRFGVLSHTPNPGTLTLVSVLIALVIAFLFTTVSAWAIAMISVTPISGMTVTTIIITAVLLSLAKLPRGDAGMLATLLIGGVVCNALSMAGGLVTNFKLGFWLGASPKRIATSAIVGSLVSCVMVCGTIMVLSDKPGFDTDGLPAPQANMMSSALQSFLGETGQVPWLTYGVGVVVALLIQLLGISPLAFGLGMYLPMDINTPILVGAVVAWLVQRSTRDEKLNKARVNKGVLIASGLIAGAAIMEVTLNFLGILDEKLFPASAPDAPAGSIMPFLDMASRLISGGTDPEALARFGNWFGLVAFLLLCAWAYWDSCRAKPES
jgi:putative OPT family oligopeptide transporter